MKILFFDIDGVLKEDKQGAPFIGESLSLLRRIVDETGAALVMSSSWKVKYKAFINGGATEYPDILRLHSSLSEYGISVYDFTPYLDIGKPLRRPAEIREYLSRADNVEAFCILDDRDEFEWSELSERLVLTCIGTDESGTKTAHLCDRHAEKAIEILNKI